jgi:nucleotide-binding universal stress UspA family protein
MWKIRKILVPTDLSAESLKALRYASEFVQSLLGVEILLVHVIEPPTYPATAFAGVVVPPPAPDVAKHCADRLDEMIKAEVPDGVQARGIVREGRPWAEVAAVATEEKADLILIATHGYTGLKHFALGSTAERVVRVAPCPVLTVRQLERDFVKG